MPDLATPQGATITCLTDVECWKGDHLGPTPDTALMESPAPSHSWIAQVQERLKSLLKLPENWDGQGARRIDPNLADGAAKLLLDIMEDDVPPPAVVPTTRGGIQLEWHVGGIDLEIETVTAHRFDVFFEDSSCGEEWEGEVSFDLEPLVRRISRFRRHTA